MANQKQVEGRLANMDPLLKKLGVLGVEHSQEAFAKEEWDGKRWESRYPNQDEPRLNIAGAVSDLLGGGSIKSSRRMRRPVLKDSGDLFRSIDWDVIDGQTVEIGSDLPYATMHNFGSEKSQKESRLPITAGVIDGLREFLKDFPKFWPKLGFLAAKRNKASETPKELITSVVQRQFVGITKTLINDSVRTIIEHFEKETAQDGDA